MCGFHGSTTGQAIGRDALSHRGPDHYGVFRDGGVVLEHWRLSIIDLSASANQPMCLPPESRCVIAYNGEVYNFRELRRQIDGVSVSSGDTEVVLRLYDRYGIDFLRRLDGMFALAIYDRSRHAIVLARDRFGIKPLYYRLDADSNLHFASELMALLLDRSLDPTLDVEAIQSLFHLLYIEGEKTPFNELRKVPPGSYLVYDLKAKTVEIARYHEFTMTDNGLSASDCVDAIEELLSESIRMHLVSDVPVGALLSGGVDSSLMVALMSKHSSDLRTYSVGYGENSIFDESRYSDLVAARYRTKHHHRVIREEDVGELVDQVCAVLDEPIGDTSVFLNYFIFGFVASSVKVCLSGLGGDELFGGYNRYLACKALPAYLNTPKFLQDVLVSMVAVLPSSRHSRPGNAIRLARTFLRNADSDLGRSYCNFIDYFSHVGRSPVLRDAPFINGRFRACWNDELIGQLDRVYKFDVENYMVNDLLFLTDRMSMRHSLEVRVPYLENRLVDFALSIPASMKIRGMTLKYLLKQVARRHLPDDVIFRRKQGFSAPVFAFLSAQRLAEVERELVESRESYVEILDKPVLRDIISRHRAGAEDFSLQIFTLIVYLTWMGTCYRRLRSRSLR